MPESSNTVSQAQGSRTPGPEQQNKVSCRTTGASMRQTGRGIDIDVCAKALFHKMNHESGSKKNTPEKQMLVGERAMLNDPTVIILMYLILPLWLAAGFADWLCHRASHIETTTGAKDLCFIYSCSRRSGCLCSPPCSWKSMV